MSKISIACIAVWDGKILIAHRIPTGQMGNRWEFPGGKVECGESEKNAAIREIKEEFGIDIKVGEMIAETSFFHNEEERLLHAYRIFVPHNGIEQKYTLTEHTEYKWVDIEEVESMDFVDSDMLLYQKIKAYLKEK